MSKIDNILINLGTNNSSQIATAVLAGFKMIFLPIATATDSTASADQKKYTIIRDIIMEGLALITYIGVTGQIQKHASAPISSAYFKHKAKMLKEGKIKAVENLTGEELEFLENVDSKKIKEAGNDYLTRLSKNRKTMSDTTRAYIEKLDNIVQKINGTKNNETTTISLNDFIKKIAHRERNVKSELIFNDIKKATRESANVLAPMKVFQNTRIALSQLSVWTLALIVIPPMCNAIIAPIMKSFDKKLSHATNINTDNHTVLQPFIQMHKPAEKQSFAKFYNYFPGGNTEMRV